MFIRNFLILKTFNCDVAFKSDAKFLIVDQNWVYSVGKFVKKWGYAFASDFRVD